MFAHFILNLAVIGLALSAETSNLRGAGAADQVEESSAQAQNKGNNDATTKMSPLERFKFDFTVPGIRPDASDGHVSRDTRSALNYNGGNPNLIFDGDLVSTSHAGSQCSGIANDLYSTTMGCRYLGNGQSVENSCGYVMGGGYGDRRLLALDNSEQQRTVREYAYVYNSRNCTGDLATWYYNDYQPCDGTWVTKCVANNNRGIKAFAHTDGLAKYDFKDMDSCLYFGAYYLGYWPDQSYDAVQFTDDYYAPTDDFSDGEGGGLLRRLAAHGDGKTASAAPHGAAGADEAEQVLTPQAVEARRQWALWVSQHPRPADIGTNTPGADASTSPASAAAVPRAAAPDGQDAAKGALHTDAVATKAVVDGEQIPYREYQMHQARNNFCAYDDKYGLYVKTACHGFKEQLSYILYIDEDCTRPIKRIVHDIYSAVPNYGMCVPSRGDKRATLTVCHNDPSKHKSLPLPE